MVVAVVMVAAVVAVVVAAAVVVAVVVVAQGASLAWHGRQVPPLRIRSLVDRAYRISFIFIRQRPDKFIFRLN